MKFEPFNKINRYKHEDCSGIVQRLERFYNKSSNQTLDLHLYQWGLCSESIHYKKINFLSPTVRLYKGNIDSEEFSSVMLGRDLNNEYDEMEADKFDKFYWRITQAIIHKRSSWGFFYFLGNIQGALNSGQINKERAVKYLELFPFELIENNKTLIEDVFGHFDENGNNLQIFKIDKKFSFEITKNKS